MLPRVVGRFVVLGTSLCLVASCSEWQTDPDGFTEQDRALIQSMKLIARVEGDPSNSRQFDPGARALGQALFFDPELSGPLKHDIPGQTFLGAAGVAGRIACVDCHSPARFFDDARSNPSNVSLGIDFTSRNSPSMVNVAFYKSFAWDGRSDSLWMQCATALESKGAMGGTRLRLARRIAATYADQYRAIFTDDGFSFSPPSIDGGPTQLEQSAAYLDGIAANSYKAMAAYLTQLVSVDAPFDAYADAGASDPTGYDALTPSQKRGLKVFLGRAGCVECHNGPNFTDNKFHSVGVPQRGEHVPLSDDGRFGGLKHLADGGQSVFNGCGPFKEGRVCHPLDASTPDDVGQFRTKSLRNVARTPPYMHAGQFQTLEEVVRFYNAGGESTGFAGTKSPMTVPLGLSEAEILDLVAFLNALTGSAIAPALTCDPSPRDGDPSAHRFAACPDGGL
jgi:cytochrome c peroxidase